MLVTGAGSGIGRAVALAYRAQGASVVAIERSSEAAASLQHEGGSEMSVVVGDATSMETLEQAVGIASARGGIDNLTCCVGVFDYYARITQLSSDELVSAWEECYRINVLGTLQAVRAVAPSMQMGSSITLTLSESAFNAVGGGVIYGSSKWALRGAVEHLAADLAPIRVNGVAPGGTTGTKFGGLSTLNQGRTADQVEGREKRIARSTLLGVVASPEDHAAAYVYLADPAASAVVTGTVMRTDGGRRIAP